MAIVEENLFLETSYLDLADSVDPVELLAKSEPDALTHSTSWRWTNNKLILTFVQVFPDGYDLPQSTLEKGSVFSDTANLPPIECHAVRHLYFLLHTDDEVSVTPNLERFWKFAHDVVDIHQPAVAGFVGLNAH